MPQLSVCSPVGFDCGINSFVSRETLGPLHPPFRISETEPQGPPRVCSPLVLNLLPAKMAFLPSASALEKEAVYSLYGWRGKRLPLSKGTPVHAELQLLEGRSKALCLLKGGW